MAISGDVREALDPFFEQGLIEDVLFEVKSGKEATVYCCRPSSTQGVNFALLAAKVYRPLESRRFRNDAVYHTGRMHLARNGRVKRAAVARSAFGREVQYSTWIDNEWSMLTRLHARGIDVPQPLARGARAILMPYFGSADAPSPNLNEAELDRSHVETVTDRLLRTIARMLDEHCVHGDLSPFNVLWWNGRAVIIDLPQAVDPRLNPAARQLLGRDVENICQWGGRRGVRRDAGSITRDLWSGFVIGELG
jgi:RIO kinase 1